MSIPDLAIYLASAHVPVFPLNGDNSPFTINGHKDANLTPNLINWPCHRVGVPIPEGIIVVDIDAHKSMDTSKAEAVLGVLDWNGAFLQNTKRGGDHYAFRIPLGAKVRQGSDLFKAAIGKGLDTRVAGKGYIATGTDYPQGPNGGILKLSTPMFLPELTPHAAAQLATKRKTATIVTSPPGTANPEEVRSALFHLGEEFYSERDMWFRCGMAVKHGLGDAGYEIWDEWAQQSPKYGDTGAGVWNSFDSKRDERIVVDWLFRKALDRGWNRAPFVFGSSPLPEGSFLQTPMITELNLKSEALTDTTPDVTPIRTGVQFMPTEMQLKYFEGCYFVNDEAGVFIPDGSILKKEQFKVRYGGYTFWLDSNGEKTTRDAYEAFTLSQANPLRWVHYTTFQPSLPLGHIVSKTLPNGAVQTAINVYQPMHGEKIQGDVTPFLVHISKLLPIPRDQEILLSYLAALIQMPGVKFQWCPLIQGVEGNGKTVFYRALEHAIGTTHCHLLDPKDKLEFTAWVEGNLLVGVEEIKIAGRHDAADAFKPLITNERVPTQKKGVDQKTGDNFANFIMTSNHKDAVLKTANDRRYCTFYTAQQSIDDLVRDGMDDTYFQNFYRWLREGGYAHIAYYLSQYPISVNVTGRAPTTSSTFESLTASLGVAEQILIDAIDLEKPGFGDLICTQDVASLLAEHGKKLGPNRIVQILEMIGYIRHPFLTRDSGRMSIDGKKRRIYVKKGSNAELLRDHLQIKELFKQIQIPIKTIGPITN